MGTGQGGGLLLQTSKRVQQWWCEDSGGYSCFSHCSLGTSSISEKLNTCSWVLVPFPAVHMQAVKWTHQSHFCCGLVDLEWLLKRELFFLFLHNSVFSRGIVADTELPVIGLWGLLASLIGHIWARHPQKGVACISGLSQMQILLHCAGLMSESLSHLFLFHRLL